MRLLNKLKVFNIIQNYFLFFRILPRSGIPLRRISIYTILIAVFYFICWTPYWCSVLYAIYMSLTSDDEDIRTQSSELLLFIIYCVHLLPYFGSASNWILYGLLNTQLQIRHESYHYVTKNVCDRIKNVDSETKFGDAICLKSKTGSYILNEKKILMLIK